MDDHRSSPDSLPFLYLFIYDVRKSTSNALKHGIDFEQAQAIWDDPRRVEVPARSDGEPRWIVIGRRDGRLWIAVFTRRGGAVRIISARRARKGEERMHEG